MEFTIGEKVRVKDYADLPSSSKNCGMARICGKEGEIVDKLYSETNQCFLYRLHLDGKRAPSLVYFTDEMIDPVQEEEAPTYRYEFDYLEKVVVCRMYEVIGDTEQEIAKGHGHIIHDGAYGIAQATSYALKRICNNLNGGELRTTKQYFVKPII